MSVFELIVRLLVAEGVGLEPNDVGCPSFVFAMATCTARIRR